MRSYLLAACCCGTALLMGSMGGGGMAFGAPAGDAVATAPAPAAVMSLDDVRKLMAGGNYQEALAGVNRRLLAGGSAAGADRHDGQLLRVECLLHLKMYSAAADSLKSMQAAEQATAPEDATKDGVFAFLIQQSPAGRYTPKTGSSKTPIDITEHDNVPKALQALFADDLANLQQRATQLASGTSAAPILDMAGAWMLLRNLEHCTSDSSAKSDALAGDLVSGAGKILVEAMKPFDLKISTISTNAARLVPDNNTISFRRPKIMAAHSHRVGLTPAERETLELIVLTCQQTVQTADGLEKAYSHGDSLQTARENAESFQKRAETVLNGKDDPGGSATGGGRKGKKRGK